MPNAPGAGGLAGVLFGTEGNMSLVNCTVTENQAGEHLK